MVRRLLLVALSAAIALVVHHHGLVSAENAALRLGAPLPQHHAPLDLHDLSGVESQEVDARR